MLLGPIFNVELLTTARRKRYFAIRVLYGLVLLFVLWSVYQSFTSYSRMMRADIHVIAAMSAAFFSAFSWLQLSAVLLLGPSIVAGVIATERERRTIEYLFASPLSNAEIVLGKLAARILHIVYLVLTGVPILALMMLLGGIAPEALLVLTVLTLCTVLTVSTLSIAVSVRSRRARDAVTGSYTLLIAWLVIPPLVQTLSRIPDIHAYLGWIAPVNDELVAANPFTVLTQTMVQASGAQVGQAMTATAQFVRNNLIASLLLAATATWSVRRVHLKQHAKAEKVRRRGWRLLRPALGDRPMLWKELYTESAAARTGLVARIATALLFLGVLALTGYMFWQSVADRSHHSYEPTFELYIGYASGIGVALACCGLLMVASRAASSVTSERDRDCWVSLLSTPLEPGEIVWAKVFGAVWSVRGVAALMAVIWGLAVLLDPVYLIAVLFSSATFVLLAFYIAALGIRYSLWCRNSLRAMAATMVTALFIGGGYWLVLMPFVMLAHGGDEGMMILLTPCIPFLEALPFIVYSAHGHFFSGGRSEGAIAVFAYVVGMAGYCGAAFALTASSIVSFDRLSGRTREEGLSGAPPAPLEAILVEDSEEELATDEAE
jgi:ABC-type transport system involved in multi-copper enzyme maturation permease subunit